MEITNKVELYDEIARLKRQCHQDEMEIRKDFKRLAKQAEDSVATMSIGFGSGVLAKKLIPFKKDGILNSLASYGLQGAVSAVAFNNSKKIKAVASAIWKNVFTGHQ